MAISVEEVKALPERDYSQRKRRSKSRMIADQALASKTGVTRITAGDAKELSKTYLALVQWTNRHFEYNLKVRKDSDCVFVYHSQRNPPSDVRRPRGRPRNKPSVE